MGACSSLEGATEKASNIAQRKSHEHGALACDTSPASSLDISRQHIHDFEGQTDDTSTLSLAANSTEFPQYKERLGGRQGTTVLLLVFFSALLIMRWKLWPNYNAELKESFYRNSSSFGAKSFNETNFILNQLRENGTTPCHNVQTNFTLFSNRHLQHFDPNATPLSLSTNAVHTILMDSYTADGTLRCSGGDYYETILYNEKWRSRPSVHDFGNGSYGISFFVDSLYEGFFKFSATILFGNFHGLEYMTHAWDVQAQVAFFQVEFFKIKSESDHLAFPTKREMMDDDREHFSMCNINVSNFQQVEWQGRWTREWVNNSCMANENGRFSECVTKEHGSCNNSSLVGWDRCSGRVSRLESNGWVYSRANCGFHIYEAQEAWDCLSGRWLVFWGDSNFQDSIRNLMLFVLNIPVPYWSTLSTFQLPRNLEEYFVNPERPDQAVHVSLIFNGHFSVWDGNLGLDSLQDSTYREYIIRHFTGNVSFPDVIIMNSGLHDGMHFDSVASYVAGVDRAVEFWKRLLDGLPSSKRSQVIYRCVPRTVFFSKRRKNSSLCAEHAATSPMKYPQGYMQIKIPPVNVTAIAVRDTTLTLFGQQWHQPRGMQSNPHKMEVFNKVMVERLLSSIPSARIVDAFDMTFPFHFNNEYSDGGHYGRAPNVDLKPWFGQPHQYFVDLMLVHVLLNSMCPSQADMSFSDS